MKVALLFPGYGSQFVGMGKELYDEYRIVQEYFEEASNCLNNNFVKLCFASSDAELSKLANAYSSLFLVGTATYAVLKQYDMPIDIVAGYNNGETSALFAAGCFSLPDGLYLLNKLCSFYQEYLDAHDFDALHISKVPVAEIELLCKKISTDEHSLFIAVYNSPTDVIVAGDQKTLLQLRDSLDGTAVFEQVGAEIGLHSALMNSVVESFKSYLEKVDFKDLKMPLISCIDGKKVELGEDIKERFLSHIYSPVDFTHIMRQLRDYDYILTVMPGDKLRDMIKEQYPDKTVMSIAKKADIDTLKEIMGEKYYNETDEK